MKTTQKLWLGILVLAILSPLGLILPYYFKAGSAWGEWGSEEVDGLVGYIPKGLAKLSSIWNAPLPDYVFKGWGEKGLGNLSFAYIISAIIGILTVICAVLIISRFIVRKK